MRWWRQAASPTLMRSARRQRRGAATPPPPPPLAAPAPGRADARGLPAAGARVLPGLHPGPHLHQARASREPGVGAPPVAAPAQHDGRVRAPRGARCRRTRRGRWTPPLLPTARLIAQPTARSRCCRLASPQDRRGAGAGAGGLPPAASAARVPGAHPGLHRVWQRGPGERPRLGLCGSRRLPGCPAKRAARLAPPADCRPTLHPPPPPPPAPSCPSCSPRRCATTAAPFFTSL